MKQLVLIALLLAAPLPAGASDHDRARRALEAGEILPLSAILAAAEAARPGRPIALELERDDGRWIYEVEWLAPDGRLYEMEIDAATATLLDVEADEDEDGDED